MYALAVGPGTPEEGYDLTMSDGWSFWVPPSPVRKAEVGDAVRLFGRGVGHPVRGLVLRAADVVFYRTPDEQRRYMEARLAEWRSEKRERFERHRDDYERRVALLPAVFQARFERFRRNKADFDWTSGDYELFVCADAVKIAEAMGTDVLKYSSFADVPNATLRRRVPTLDLEAHTGNTLDCALFLARLYIGEPETVALAHGALCPLTGCEDSGCSPKHERSTTAA